MQSNALHGRRERLDLQDTLPVSQAQTTHTPLPSATYRVQLSPEVLDPLCHGLGHAIFRMALAKQQSPQFSADRPALQGLDLTPFMSLIAGRIETFSMHELYLLTTLQRRQKGFTPHSEPP